MPNNLNTFIGHITERKVARQNKFRVEVWGPTGAFAYKKGPAGDPIDPLLSLMCESITFPGTNVRSVPDTLRYGPAREQGQGMTYGPFTATFICSPDLREKVFFETWQQAIVNHKTWEVNFYDEYRGTVKIFQLDDENNDTYSVIVREAYPKTISPQDLSWSSNDSYQTVQVEFTYRFWEPKEQTILTTVALPAAPAWAGALQENRGQGGGGGPDAQ